MLATVRLLAKVRPHDFGIAHHVLADRPSAILRPATSTARRCEKSITARMMCSIMITVTPCPFSRISSAMISSTSAWLKARHRLVGDQQLGLGGHGARELELAHLDLRQVARQAVAPCRPARPGPAARGSARRSPRRPRCAGRRARSRHRGSGMRRFSASDRLPNGRGSWKLRARPSRVRWCADSPSSAAPAKRTLPCSLRRVPQMQFTRVDLPEPFGPDQAEPLALLDLEVDRPAAPRSRRSACRDPSTCSSAVIASSSGTGRRCPAAPAITKATISTPATSTLTAEEIVTLRYSCRPPTSTAPTTGPSQLAGAADQRHGDGVDRVVQAEARRGVEVGHVVGQRRAGHAHEAAGQRRGDQLQLAGSARPRPRPPPRRRGWRQSRSPARSARCRAPSPAR